MQDERKNGGVMRNDRNFNSGMRDKNTTTGAEFALFDREDAGFQLDGGIGDKKTKITRQSRTLRGDLQLEPDAIGINIQNCARLQDCAEHCDGSRN